MVTRSTRAAQCVSLMVFAGGGAACAACGDGGADPAGSGGAGGASASVTSATATSTSTSTTATTTTGTGGGGDDGRRWEELSWEGLPCTLLVAGPTSEPTLIWQPCATPGCSFIDPTPFTPPTPSMPDATAVTTTHQLGNVGTALVQRAGYWDSVVWDLSTGNERFAIRGHPDCMPNRFLPFVVEGEERGWFGMQTSGGGFADAAFYEVDLSSSTATKLGVPIAMTANRMAGDANHLAIETTGNILGIWSRAAGTFTLLAEPPELQLSMRPRTGGGGVYFMTPDAQGDLDVAWWQGGTQLTAVVASPGNFAVNPWIVGGDLVWTEAPGYTEPGVVKRAPLEPSAFPLAGEVVASLANAGVGRASERFYVSATKVGAIYRLQVVNLETKTVTNIDLPEEVKWPSAVDFVGKDPFGEKEVAWVQANDTVYRIEIE